MTWVKVTYWDTMYNREATMNTNEIVFKNGHAEFASMGSRYAIRIDRIIKIEGLE